MAPHHMTREQKQMARRLKAKGLTLKAIARDLSCSLDLVTTSVYGQRAGAGRPDRWTPAPGRLSAEEREEILLGLARGESMSAIGRSLGRAPSTITREVAANGGAGGYGAWRAHCRAEASSRRPKPAKLAHPPLVRQVTTWLERAVVTPGDRRALAPGVPRRSDDAGEPRDHLPVPLRPRPW